MDTDNRTVRAADGRILGFDTLLVATGGTPIVPAGIPNEDARGVFTFTTWDDARRIRAFIMDDQVTRAVVVGGGLIGLKSMEALQALGLHVTVVELADRILSATFDRTASDLARRHMEKAGVEVRCSTTLAAVEAPDGKVAAVALRTGERIPCGLVLFAVGVRPATQIVAGTPIEVDRGILVNERMETSVPGIYAAGDVAQALDALSGVRRPIPILPNACRQGVVAGSNMAGKPRTYRGGMAMNAVDIMGLPTISVGMTDPVEADAKVLSRLDPEEPSYRKVVLRDNRVIGAIFVGANDRAGIITGLIRERVDVSGIRNLLLTDELGIISLPAEYRKHVVRGHGIEV